MPWEGRASQSELLDKAGTAGKNPDHQGEISLIPQPGRDYTCSQLQIAVSLFQPQKAQGIQKSQWGMELEPGSCPPWNPEKGGGGTSLSSVLILAVRHWASPALPLTSVSPLGSWTAWSLRPLFAFLFEVLDQ